MRRIAQGFLWLIKGTLLMIGLSALALWPWSLRHQGMVERFRWTLRPDRVELVRFAIGWADGRVGFGERRFEFTAESLGRGRAGIAREGEGWQWRVIRTAPWVVAEAPIPAWGPFRWGRADYEERAKLIPAPEPSNLASSIPRQQTCRSHRLRQSSTIGRFRRTIPGAFSGGLNPATLHGRRLDLPC